MNKKTNLLISGGAGFIGNNLVDYLLKTQQYKITVLDNLSAGNFNILKETVETAGGELEQQFTPSSEKVCFYKEDILNKDAIFKLLKGQNQVVHLAAQTGVMPSLDNPHLDCSINVMGILNMLTASVEHKIGSFMFSSSAAPVGEQTPPLDEKKVPRPLSPYGASKLAGEGYCSAFCGSYGLNTTVLRFSNVYGPLSFHKGSVVALFIRQMLKGEALEVYGDGEQTRDFLFSGDIVRVVHTLLQSNPANTKGQIFQLGTGVETSVNHLIRLLTEVTGLSPVINHQPARAGEIVRNYTKIDKIKEILNYQPQYPLLRGLEMTWEWFCKNKVKE